jgi:cyclin-dependent kinase-like
MDYFGSPLDSVIDSLTKSQSYFPREIILKVTYGLLCALKFLGKAGVMHRDIKPNNVLVDEDLKIKICDFGYSRTCSSETRI